MPEAAAHSRGHFQLLATPGQSPDRPVSAKDKRARDRFVREANERPEKAPVPFMMLIFNMLR